MTNHEFEVLLSKAIAGNHTAIEAILELYAPLIDKYCWHDGSLDEDCRQYILLRIVMQIGKFVV